jgi:hypothetical protein
MKVLRIDSAGILKEVNVSGDFGEINFTQEPRTLTLSEELAGFIELASTPVANSVSFQVDGVSQIEGTDFTVAEVSGVYRITLINDLAIGGISELVTGDKILITYAVTPIVPTVEFRKEQVILDITDIMNQYFDLSDQVIDLSEKFICSGLLFTQGVHYSLENTGGITRVHFEGNLSVGGLSPLEPGDIIEVVYAVNV